MELHKALQHIIKTDGCTILTQPRLVNILSDLQAYQAMPAAKYIISSMITDGYMQQLLLIGKWNTNCERLLNKYAQETGFQFDMISNIFQSIAFGLKWKQTIDVTTSSNAPVTTKAQISDASALNLSYRELYKKSEEFVSDYIEKCQNYLDSIIEIQGDWEKELGAKFQITSFYKVYANAANVGIIVEVIGGIKVRVDYHISYKFVLYNKQGRIIDSSIGLLDRKEKKRTSRLL